MARLAADIQDATGDTVTLAYIDQGYTGQAVAETATAAGIKLKVVKLPEAKRGSFCSPGAGLWTSGNRGREGEALSYCCDPGGVARWFARGRRLDGPIC